MQRVRKPLIRREISEDAEFESLTLVTKVGGVYPRFFVSAESKQLNSCGSRLESAVASGFGSADLKGLAGAGKAGTRLSAEELTKGAGRGAVSQVRTAATIQQ